MYSEIKLLRIIKNKYQDNLFSLSEISTFLNVDKEKLREDLLLLSSKDYLSKHSQYIKGSVKDKNGFRPAELTFRLTNLGSQFIENYVGKWIKHYIPLILSIIAILISIFSIYLQYIHFFNK